MISNYKGIPYGLYNNLYINVFLEAIGIFVFVKNLKFNIKLEESKIFTRLVKCSFGIYVLHVFSMELLKSIGLTTLIFNPIFSVPIIVILIFGISSIISGILNHIPILKKYIV